MTVAGREGLSTLQAEYEFLLLSLRDLEAEKESGDIDLADYEQLKNAYTARAAQVIRQIKSVPETGAPPSGVDRGSFKHRAIVLGGLLAFVLVAGYLLAQAAGERGVNDELSGSIDRTPREQVLICQNLGPTKVQESLECYQNVLDVDPDNVEAHTYRGWALVLVVGSAQQSGNAEAAAVLLPQAMKHFDRAIEINPEFPDVRAFRAVVFEAEGEPAKACDELTVLDSVNPPPLITELTAPLRARLGC